MEDIYSSFDQNSRASEPITPRIPITLAKVVILQCIFNLASLHNSSQLPVASEIQRPTDIISYLPSLAVKGDLVSIQALFAAAGLHRCPCRYGKLTADECDIRKRLFWCIYVFDRYLSQALGHPLGIQDSDVDVCPLGGPELHHPLLYPTVPSSHSGVNSPFSGLSLSVDATVTTRQSEIGLGRATSEDESSQKQSRHSSLSFQVQYSRLLGRALELFHKSLHIRSIDSGQLVLLIHRPRLSLEPSTPEFQSAIQICISEAREIIKITSKQVNAGYTLFWPGYLSVTWMAGVVLAFACQLRLYSAEKGKREIGMCLDALLHMSERWKLAKNCYTVLSDLAEAIQEMEDTAKRPAFDISDSTMDSGLGIFCYELPKRFQKKSKARYRIKPKK
ncbi:hypothetical protein LB503_004966 [Fusarium chuoi]|nr:hypothetical protein LB503_004966 [Fusarium chuoi]